MTSGHDSEKTPLDRVEDVPRILKAMREAVREALLRHKRLGNPVAVWKEGRVVWLQPEDIPAEILEPERRGDCSSATASSRWCGWLRMACARRATRALCFEEE